MVYMRNTLLFCMTYSAAHARTSHLSNCVKYAQVIRDGYKISHAFCSFTIAFFIVVSKITFNTCVALNASYIALACLNVINYIIDSRLIDI